MEALVAWLKSVFGKWWVIALPTCYRTLLRISKAPCREAVALLGSNT